MAIGISNALFSSFTFITAFSNIGECIYNVTGVIFLIPSGNAAIFIFTSVLSFLMTASMGFIHE